MGTRGPSRLGSQCLTVFRRLHSFLSQPESTCKKTNPSLQDWESQFTKCPRGPGLSRAKARGHGYPESDQEGLAIKIRELKGMGRGLFLRRCGLNGPRGQFARPGAGGWQAPWATKIKDTQGWMQVGQGVRVGVRVVWRCPAPCEGQGRPHCSSVLSGQSRNPHDLRPLWICQLQLHWDHAGRPE